MSEESAYGFSVDENGRSIRNAVKVQHYLELIRLCRGNVSAMAREEGISRSVCKQYIDKCPELVSALNDWRQEIVDKAEDNIFILVEKGDGAASKMVVSMLGKDRGWVAREEQTGKDGTPLIPSVIEFTTYEEEPEADAADGA